MGFQTLSLTDAQTLRDVLFTHASVQPHAPFLIAPETGHLLTYSELLTEALSLNARLQAAGLKPGDHVGLYLNNGLQTAAIFLGAMAAGYVIAPFNLVSQTSQLAYTIDHSDVRVVFTSADLRGALDAALATLSDARRAQIAVCEIDPDAPGIHAGFGEAPLMAPITGKSPALLMYTSGTTGVPKGALSSHANLMHTGRTASVWHDLTPNDRVLSSLPLYHINGQCIATVTPFVSGGSIIAPRKFSVGQWWGWVEAHRPTWINVVPTIIAYLLNQAEAGKRYAFPSVRFGRSASAPLPPEHHKAFEQTFGIGVCEAMGMTECASMVFCNPQAPDERKYGTPGKPCGVEAKVIDAQGVEQTESIVGELCLRGPNVMFGYYKAPDKTRNAFDAEGWLRTGDLGYRDADGFYFVTGRIKELIIKGGENIAPREIDEALMLHPAVLEAAAVGIPDANYGQEILAAVVLRPGTSVDEALLRAHCLSTLGKFKTPKVFRFVGDLPKGASGKVQRLKLLDQ